MTAACDKTLDQIERKIRGELPLKRNMIVGISGVDGAGKSTLSAALCQRLQVMGIAHHLIEIDDFLHPRSVRNANPNQTVGYYCDTFAFKKIFDQLLIPLSQCPSHRVEFQLVDWPSDETKSKVYDIHGPAVIVVEGVFLFKLHYAEVFNLRLWLDISFEDALERVLQRSRDQNYYRSPDAITDRYLERFYAGQRLHLERDDPKGQAHIVIDAVATKLSPLHKIIKGRMHDTRRCE